MKASKQWDIFCKVIDNYGDIGVCWRLACGLAAQGQRVRLWVDDASALRWMALPPLHGPAPIELRDWTPAGQPQVELQDVPPADVLVEAFGCEIAPEYIALHSQATRLRGQNSLKNSATPCWINLEYLTAEAYAQRNHTLPSPVLHGPGVGLTKHFFYPGFTTGTGGLLREADLASRQSQFDRGAWLATYGIAWPSKPAGERVVSLFCYEPPALGALLDALAQDPSQWPTRLLVTQGRASRYAQALINDKNSRLASWNKDKLLSISYLPSLPQTEFDHLLWASDLNFVRGEDSLVRALWAGKPWVWHIYPQDDGAHHAKLDALLTLFNAPPIVRAFHARWNADNDPNADANANATPHSTAPLSWPCAQDWQLWCAFATRVRAQLLAQTDLVTQLMRFCGVGPGHPNTQ